MDLTTLTDDQLKELAMRLYVESSKADRAGCDREAPVHVKMRDAVQALADRGIWATAVFVEADERFIAYIRASHQPGFDAVIDEDGTLSEAAVTGMLAAA